MSLNFPAGVIDDKTFVLKLYALQKEDLFNLIFIPKKNSA
jgi:hypothetical protein